MTRTKQEIGARVDALAHDHEGDAFVAAMERLSAELSPEDRRVLQQVLLERAADEADFQQALRKRALEKSWTRRTLAKLEGLVGDDRADALADALEAGPAGAEALARETETLRGNRGRTAVVLDELSRHRSPRVRAWVPGAGAEILGDGAARLILSLTRDREAAVRDAAVTALVGLGPVAVRPLVPDLRRRLHSPDLENRCAAMWALADLGDGASLSVIEARSEAADTAVERSAARAAALVLKGDEVAVIAGLGEQDDEAAAAFAVAARILGTEAALDALRRVAETSTGEAGRSARAELEKVDAEGA
ncbi:MAG: HEAT repeat domain-containing protein [Gaiellaceae bacterium]